MAEIETDLERLDGLLGELEASIGSTQTVTAAFQREVQGMNSSLQAAVETTAGLSRSISSQLGNAFEALIFDGARLSDVLLNVARGVTNTAFNQAIRPVTDGLGNLLAGGIQNLLSGILPFADGGVMTSGRVSAFANGGVINGPTTFPMRGGTGLMGEAGPEAIMPLSRGADGRLGVRGGGATQVNVTMNITTPDAQSFLRSRSQVAAQVSRALQRGTRNL